MWFDDERWQRVRTEEDDLDVLVRHSVPMTLRMSRAIAARSREHNRTNPREMWSPQDVIRKAVAAYIETDEYGKPTGAK